jgi:hypothetical protein
LHPSFDGNMLASGGTVVMSNGTQVSSSRRKRAWFAVGFAVVAGFVMARSRLITGMEHAIKLVLGLSLVAFGLYILFPLAAFGPKTEEQVASRVRMAGIGVWLVLIGTGELVADSRISLALSVFGLVFLLLSRVMAPGRAG